MHVRLNAVMLGFSQWQLANIGKFIVMLFDCTSVVYNHDFTVLDQM